jgi:hypothetical protein
MSAGQDRPDKEAKDRPVEDLQPGDEAADVKGGVINRPSRPSASWE